MVFAASAGKAVALFHMLLNIFRLRIQAAANANKALVSGVAQYM